MPVSERENLDWSRSRSALVGCNDYLWLNGIGITQMRQSRWRPLRKLALASKWNSPANHHNRVTR